MYRLINPIRRYDWGSTSLLQDFCGLERDGRPAAEMWMGAHPDDPSLALVDGRRRPLDDLIDEDPSGMLGDACVEAFGPRLPFLVKLLAAARPLSIQVHPDSAQALEGFTAEEATGVERDSPCRRYRDPSHKPELIYALSRFELMAGVRPARQAAALIESLGLEALAHLVSLLRDEDDLDPVRSAFTEMLRWRCEAWDLGATVAAAAERAASQADDAVRHEPDLDDRRRALSQAARLGREFGDDPGLLAPLLLNVTTLAPAEAVFVRDRTLHAYLGGLGVEVMASSDNVLRAGLTAKHVDGDEVLRIADFTPAPLARLSVSGGRIEPPAREFRLTIAGDAGGDPPRTGPRIALCVEDEIALAAQTGRLALRRGEAAFIAGSDGPLLVEGAGRVVIAHI